VENLKLFAENVSRKNPKLKYRSVWQFPTSTEDFIKKHTKGKILHVCCGSSNLGDVRIDRWKQENQKSDGFIIADMFHLPIKRDSFDTVIADPPWNLAYHVRHRLIFSLRDSIKWSGHLIFNCLWFPKIKCMKLQDLFAGMNNMAFRNVSLIGIYKKIQEQLC
jgi:23S rRNA A2030 N6-methylase RlmJ